MKTAQKKIYRFFWPIALCLIAVLQFGCGQKGPLYFPDEAGERTQPKQAEQEQVQVQEQL